jgi:hypothetical protein
MSDLKMQPLAPGARYPAPQPDVGLQQEAGPQPDQGHQQEDEAQPDPNAPKEPEEPPRIVMVGRIPVVGLTVDEEVFYKGFMKKRAEKLRLKIDVRLLPPLSALYLLATLNRANIANAKIEGLKEDTNLTDAQYNVVLAIFFLPYCLLGWALACLAPWLFIANTYPRGPQQHFPQGPPEAIQICCLSCRHLGLPYGVPRGGQEFHRTCLSSFLPRCNGVSVDALCHTDV